jgi:CubicO group peptidase (beta-lactamase class C family)
MDGAINTAFSQELSPGFAIGIVVNDEIIYQKGFGYADLKNKIEVKENTGFYIASTTKALTALAALSLVNDGLLSLDAPISDYLPELSLSPPLNPDSISVLDLLAHTHGIDNRGPVVLRTAFTGQFEKNELSGFLSYHNAEKEQGVFRYGNIGYNILGMVMEAVTKKDWKSVVQERVLFPVGMTGTSAFISTINPNNLALPHKRTESGFEELYLSKKDANMHAAGGHFSTIQDMSKFLLAMINNGRIGNDQIFPADLILLSRQPISVQDRSFWEYKRFAWSPGWDICEFRSDTVYTRFGSYGGYFSYLGYCPGNKFGIVAFTNESELGPTLIKLTTSYAIDLLRGRMEADSLFTSGVAGLAEVKSKYFKEKSADLEKRAERQKTALPFPLQSYVGTYRNDVMGTMVWKLDDSQLKVEMGVAQCQAEIFSADENALRVELMGGGSVVTFKFTDGNPESLEFLGFEFKRVK